MTPFRLFGRFPLLPAVILFGTTAVFVMTTREAQADACADGTCPSIASASHCPDCCVRCGLRCLPGKLVAKQVMVPITVTETRLKTCIEKVTKEFEVKCTVFRREPTTQTIKKKVCYLEDEVRTKVVDRKICARVKNPTVTTFDVDVPHQEVRFGPPPADPCRCGDTGDGDCPCECATTSQCQGSECTATAIVTDGAGSEWDNLAAVDPMACPRTVCVTKREPRSTECEKEDVVFVTKSEVVSYCVKVPKYREEVCKEVTEYKLVPVVKTKKIVECVPEIVKRPIEVQVTKMVPKTIFCCQACAACQHK